MADNSVVRVVFDEDIGDNKLIIQTVGGMIYISKILSKDHNDDEVVRVGYVSEIELIVDGVDLDKLLIKSSERIKIKKIHINIRVNHIDFLRLCDYPKLYLYLVGDKLPSMKCYLSTTKMIGICINGMLDHYRLYGHKDREDYSEFMRGSMEFIFMESILYEGRWYDLFYGTTAFDLKILVRSGENKLYTTISNKLKFSFYKSVKKRVYVEIKDWSEFPEIFDGGVSVKQAIHKHF
jgi:hypothetical protein